MLWFIAFFILLLTAIGWFLFAPPARMSSGGTTNYASWKPWALVPLVLAFVCLLFSLTAVVGARNVGVPTSFSRPTGDTLSSGLHWKAPWINVTDIDATVQPEEYKGNECIYVKIADAGSACISLAYRWRINPEGADTVYADYRNSDEGITEGVRKALVSTNIKAAINEVFGSYDPMADIEITDDMTPQEIAAIKIQLPDLKTFNEDIKLNVEDKIAGLGDLIEIQSVTVSYVKLPEKTQERIDQFNAKIMEVKLAMQDVAIKQAQASANLELADSLKDPNVLVSKCLDGLISGEIKAPAGFQCFPGSGGSVVVPSA